jgi:hypothetical protein
VIRLLGEPLRRSEHPIKTLKSWIVTAIALGKSTSHQVQLIDGDTIDECPKTAHASVV